MPVVDFLTDEEAAAYGRYAGAPSRADLERVFFLDDEDRALVERHRGEHMRLGFSLQLVTVRWVGAFLEDPLDVPVVVLDFVAEQLGIADASQVKRYTERPKTRFDHQWEIRRTYGLREFAAAEAELRAWVAARSWTSGDGPKAIFVDAVGWLRERDVLLPGVTTLARLVAQVRDDTTRRLWGVLEGLLTVGQRYVLDQLLEVPPGSRVSDLEKWCKGPAPRGSGPTMVKALDQVAEVMGLGTAELGAEALVPPRRLAELAKASARLAVAVEALFDSDGCGGPEEEPLVSAVWEAIEAVVSRSELRAALVLVNDSVPPADAADPDDWRSELVGRYTTVSGFLKMLPKVIEFGANAEGAAVLAAMQTLPDVLAYRSRLSAPLIPARTIEHSVVNGPWKRLVFGHPAHEGGAVNRHAYTFCVLEQFYRHLKRRDIYADASTKWRNPQAQLLEGRAWEAVRADVLTTLGLPDDPDELLAEHAQTLDTAYRQVGGRLAANTEVRVDDEGKIHLTGVKAVEEPPSLVDLRARTTAMLPRVDLPEVILEVMSWEPSLAAAFTAVSGGADPGGGGGSLADSPNMTDEAAGPVALVTGAGSGIGAEIAVALLGSGYRVALAGRRGPALWETAARARDAKAADVLAVPADVTSPGSVEALFAAVEDKWGRLDLLVNNAGLFGTPAPVEDFALEEWTAVIDTNLTGAFLCARQAFRSMKRQSPQGGRIINNGSLSAHTPRPNAVAYTASKHAMTGLTKALSLEGRRHGIACGQIDVGNAATDMTAGFGAGALQADDEVRPEPRMDVRHVAGAVLYMGSLPLGANVQFLTVMATEMPSFVGRG